MQKVRGVVMVTVIVVMVVIVVVMVMVVVVGVGVIVVVVVVVVYRPYISRREWLTVYDEYNYVQDKVVQGARSRCSHPAIRYL